MDNPRLIPFKAEHLLTFTSRDYEYHEPYEDMLEKEKRGPAFTATANGEIIGCAGVIIQWTGMGSAWAVFSPKISTYPIWTTRMVRRALRDIVRSYQLKRIEMAALKNNVRNQNWALFLGFTPERNGVARSFGYNGEDLIRYELIVRR